MNHWNLSMRQRQVIECAIAGFTSKEIGRILSLSSKTVELHVNSAIDKMQARNRTHAAVLWDRAMNRSGSGIGRAAAALISDKGKLRLASVLVVEFSE